MLAQEPRGGAIVNTSSVNGLGGVPQAALYAAAKAGVLALTKAAALEYAPQSMARSYLDLYYQLRERPTRAIAPAPTDMAASATTS